jgi:thioredoxin 1
VQTVSRASFDTEVLSASRDLPVLVDFWGPRCGPCMQMMPWVENLAQQHMQRLKIVKLNSDENRRLCVDLRIMGLPTFVLFRDGVEVQRLSGSECTPSAISHLVTATLSD